MSTSCRVAEESRPCPCLRLRPLAVASNCEPVESVGTGPSLPVPQAVGTRAYQGQLILVESVPIAAVQRKHLNRLWAASVGCAVCAITAPGRWGCECHWKQCSLGKGATFTWWEVISSIVWPQDVWNLSPDFDSQGVTGSITQVPQCGHWST